MLQPEKTRVLEFFTRNKTKKNVYTSFDLTQEKAIHEP